MAECRDIEEKLSGYLDGALTQQDRQAIEVHLDRCDACRTTVAELERIREGVAGLTTPQPTAQQWSRMMSTTVSKTSRGLGWLLGLAGGLVLASYAAYKFATADATEALVKIAVAGLVVGLFLLLVSVAADRLRARKTDKYKDVEL